jgi:hypothetical protein
MSALVEVRAIDGFLVRCTFILQMIINGKIAGIKVRRLSFGGSLLLCGWS